MITQIATQTPAIDTTERPMPVRIIRKVNGRYEFVELQSEAELTAAEKREIYCSMFNIYE
jgi:hypothetical protein